MNPAGDVITDNVLASFPSRVFDKLYTANGGSVSPVHGVFAPFERITWTRAVGLSATTHINILLNFAPPIIKIPLEGQQ